VAKATKVKIPATDNPIADGSGTGEIENEAEGVKGASAVPSVPTYESLVLYHGISPPEMVLSVNSVWACDNLCSSAYATVTKIFAVKAITKTIDAVPKFLIEGRMKKNPFLCNNFLNHS
jgi:hypothetical protein